MKENKMRRSPHLVKMYEGRKLEHLEDAISRASIPELLVFYKDSMATKRDSYIRDLIDSSSLEMSKVLKFPPANNFRELVILNDTYGSPLNDLPISLNGFVLIPEGGKIQFSQKKFFSMLQKHKNIIGVKSLFDDNVESSFSFSVIKLKDGKYRLSLKTPYNRDNPFLTKNENFSLTEQEISTDDRISQFFDEGGVPLSMACNGMLLIEDDGEYPIRDLVLDTMEDERYKGTILFPTIDLLGEYGTNSRYEISGEWLQDVIPVLMIVLDEKVNFHYLCFTKSLAYQGESYYFFFEPDWEDLDEMEDEEKLQYVEDLIAESLEMKDGDVNDEFTEVLDQGNGNVQWKLR